MLTLAQLTANLPQQGSIYWIGLRPEKRGQMRTVQSVEASPEQGLIGDRHARPGGKRQVTLIQAEHLTAIASLLGLAEVKPESLRRNVVVSGLNLLALKGKRFRLGDAVLEYTGACHPCSRMEETFGPGGYNAVRGHGGITARVVQAGSLSVGSPVSALVEVSS